MATRTDFYNYHTDIAIETALTTLTNANLKSRIGDEAPVPMNRAEALRFLVRRATKKMVGNKTRRVAANEAGVPQS